MTIPTVGRADIGTASAEHVEGEQSINEQIKNRNDCEYLGILCRATRNENL